MYKYFPHTEDDLQAMMEKVGVKNLDELYAQIPEHIRFKGDYELPRAASEPLSSPICCNVRSS